MRVFPSIIVTILILWSQFYPKLFGKIFQVVTRNKVRLAEGHGDRCFGCKLLQYLGEKRLDKGCFHRYLAHFDGDHKVTLTNCKNDPLEGGGLFSRLLQALEGLATRIEFAAGARYQTAGLHRIDMYALFALGLITEFGLCFKPLGFGKSTQQHIVVVYGDWAVIYSSLTGFAAVQGKADGSLGRGEKFNDACATIVGKLIAEDNFVGPGHRITRLILTGRVADQEIHPQSGGVEDMLFQLRARLGDRPVLSKIDAGRWAGILRVDTQPDHASVIGTRL